MDELESLYLNFARRGDTIERLDRHIARLQGIEAELVGMLLRAERSEAWATKLYTALSDLVRCHAGGGFVQPDDDVLEAARCALGVSSPTLPASK